MSPVPSPAPVNIGTVEMPFYAYEQNEGAASTEGEADVSPHMPPSHRVSTSSRSSLEATLYAARDSTGEPIEFGKSTDHLGKPIDTIKYTETEILVRALRAGKTRRAMVAQLARHKPTTPSFPHNRPEADSLVVMGDRLNVVGEALQDMRVSSIRARTRPRSAHAGSVSKQFPTLRSRQRPQSARPAMGLHGDSLEHSIGLPHHGWPQRTAAKQQQAELDQELQTDLSRYAESQIRTLPTLFLKWCKKNKKWCKQRFEMCVSPSTVQ